MKTIRRLVNDKPWFAWVLFGLTMMLVFVIGLFAASIMERRTEALLVFTPATDIRDWEPRSEVWGQYFPREYQTWLMTREMDFRSKYNGNAMIDMLEEDPRLVVLWAGYGFAKDYNQSRGHYWAIDDTRETLRTGAPIDGEGDTMPNTCWTCKSPDVPRVMSEIGAEEFYKGPWSSRGDEIVNPIGCADCHDPKTMNLQISRPALIEAFERQGKDITQSSYQDMRTLVCAQCHVEYYFKGKGEYLTFPWDEGMTVEDMERYYDNLEFADWTHALSKTPMLKAQHPGYEIFQMGIHSQRGLACADCHMPYISDGSVKFTNHQVVSPLKHVPITCQVCHRESEADLIQNVYERQEKNIELRLKAEDLLVKAHIEAKAAWDLGATDEEMKPILRFIRHAQWRWDFVSSSHGASFHAPLEVARILGTSIDKVQEARIALVRVLAHHGHSGAVSLPDISTKQKAQEYIGLDVQKLEAEKGMFLTTEVPQWDEASRQRQEPWDRK